MSRIFGFRLKFSLGPGETIRMLRNVSAGRRRLCDSVALETYWSRGAIRGATKPFATSFAPSSAATAPIHRSRSLNILPESRTPACRGDGAFDFCIQRFIDEKITPIEDTSVEWKDRVSPPEPVATLTIPKEDVGPAGALPCSGAVEGLSFNPWNTTDDFRRLGISTAPARRPMTQARRIGWAGASSRPGLRNRILAAAAGCFSRQSIDSSNGIGCPFGGACSISTYCVSSCAHNLIDTEPHEAPPRTRKVPPAPAEQCRISRTFDGRTTIVGARYGCGRSGFRTQHEAGFQPGRFDIANPIAVSRELLNREAFIPARSLNLFAAGWIQFQVHDWVDHARYALGERMSGCRCRKVPLLGQRAGR